MHGCHDDDALSKALAYRQQSDVFCNIAGRGRLLSFEKVKESVHACGR